MVTKVTPYGVIEFKYLAPEVKMLKITLPIPPSVNGYWRTFRKRQILSEKGREYRGIIRALLALNKCYSPVDCRLAVNITYYFRDNRRRDIDNFAKAILDNLQAGKHEPDNLGLFLDDSQIDTLLQVRASIDRDNPRAVVELIPIEDSR